MVEECCVIENLTGTAITFSFVIPTRSIPLEVM